MRASGRKAAHVLERLGLAMAGASCGLFVGLHVGSTVAWLTSQGFLLLMMLSGAVGFYLGIDTPTRTAGDPPGRSSDAAELLSAAGTFLAALTAFVSVGVIALHENPHMLWTAMIMLGWTVGVIMQIGAGAIARSRA